MFVVYSLTIIIQVSLCSGKQDILYGISNALHKTVDYMVKNNDRLDLQGYFGIIRAKALLTEINLSGIDDNNALLLLNVHKKIDIIWNEKYRNLQFEEEWVHQILEYDLWRRKIDYKYLNTECLIQAKNKTVKLVRRLYNEADNACIIPNMFEFCMSNMYDQKKLSIMGGFCRINSSCKYFMFDTYLGIGYETTHRLLYIQTFRAWIYKRRVFYNDIIQAICLNIHDQTLATVGRGPFFDLFLEQIFLCGVEGYMEFLNVNWLKIILSNQLPGGCFPLFHWKYSANLTSMEGCSEHATGLAIATLSLHMHFFFELRSLKHNF